MGVWKKEDEMKNEPLRLTTDMWDLLELFKGSERIVWDLTVLDGNKNHENFFNIANVDISDKPSTFSIKRRDLKFFTTLNIETFLKKYFGSKHSQNEISEFVREYNEILFGEQQQTKIELIQPRPFKFEPTNIKETFISLVTETYPMGHEEEVVPFITPGLKRDKFGNYYTIIGNSDVAFTSHLDTASRTKSKVGLVEYVQDGDTFIKTDGKSILGADDKSGVTVMMYMISQGVPGVYWFFYGEERGGQGSSKAANNIASYPFMEGIKKIISFDRRNYFSVITSQLGLECCSNEFALQLCEELTSAGLKMNIDPTGVFTDSANFIDLIPECTNVSVGYFNEHTHDEIQNITFLEKLAKACVKVNWSGLKAVRDIGGNLDISAKYSRFLKMFNKAYLHNDESYKVKDGKIIIEIQINDLSTEKFIDDVETLQELFAANKLNPDIEFEDNIIKIELR
jgi:hypothetical protein